MSAARAIGLVLGVAADGALGDPRRRPPVTAFRRLAPGKGAAVAGAAVAAGLLLERAGRGRPLVQASATAVTTWAVLGAAGLAVQGTELARDLEESRFDPARATLSELDPRVADGLELVGLSRASVETLAENTSDAVVAPLVWGALAGVPGLLGARAVSLLRRARVGRHGHWAIDRLDELVHLVPTRVAAGLTVVAAPVVGGSAGGAWRAWRRDTIAHPSPNAGRVEAAFAGALEVRVGGRTVYPHGVAELPVLGVGRNPDAGHVTRAVELSRVVGWLAAVTSVVLAVVAGFRRRTR
ncbi:cobalamin biosynthesis protein CobD [Amycolatopsis sp. NBRC 101858]|uniref:cobalamin biosynthesis protein CobD/CbiB n=1 Tax=Amycolatopsis sp. NBRC 101858 TaxID=3032200 RepID=UPI0024A338BE|nr:cobalamin biosynthesis protein [Amycolatopsis sp. NBRC 101858]GLY41785.1 cobalamin biosynthesis protein CobD [Amycolatopsis sp. NBRC 101858]